MNKQLNFGNHKGLVINDLNIKNKIIDYLYNKINISNYRYIILKDLQKLDFLKKNPHFVTPNYKGRNYYMIFFQLNHNNKLFNYCVAIDKKNLSYHKDQIEVKNIFIIRLKVNVSKSIFNGTILDTKLIRKNHDYIMLIKDCFCLMGHEILNMDMITKMKHIDNIIKNNFDKNCCSNFAFRINKFYNYDQLDELINDIIPSCSFETNGIIFYPKFSGITVIFIEKKKEKINIESKTDVVIKSINLISNLENLLKTRIYSYEQEGKKKKLWLNKTSITDVYNIFETKNKNKRIGIAHIPNLKISHMCQKLIKNDTDVICFNCIYNKKFKKWIPLNSI